ncbi:MAG: sulfatase-like hydrolase/transferase [bacterium]|nr:sulfatase-like hydrolase/transferase [bacterium]
MLHSTDRFRPMASGVSALAAALAIAATLATATACGLFERWNLLIVTFDTTRADHIGAYGYQAASTPNVDGLARDGVLFQRALTPVPITLPSHTTILTGRYPTGHGVRDNGLFVVPEEELTLAEILRSEGYRTAAAVGSFPLISRFGLAQGFELFDDKVGPVVEDLLGRRRLPKSGLFFDERRAARVNEAVFPWLEEHHREPFFLWVHYFDPHQPQQPPPPYNQLFAGKPYAGEIAYADECLGTLLDRLRTLGVDQRTLVVFTADHGEGLGEHREDTHSILAYNSTLHVPLVMRIPGGPAQRLVGERVGTVDIVPTVLELLGVRAPDRLHGRSLVPLLTDRKRWSKREEPPPYYAETLSPRLANNWGELRAFFLGRYKYIHGPRPELFNLAADTGELDNLVTEEPQLAADMRRELQAFLSRQADPRGDARTGIDEETIARLEALGYLHAAGDDSEIREILRQGGTPPQDRVGDVNEMSMAKNHLFRGQPLAAREAVLNLLERDPENPFYLDLLAQAELGMGRPEAALAALERIADDTRGRQSLPATLMRMGFVLFLSGERERGVEMVQKAQGIKAGAEGQYLLATMLSELGRHEERTQALERTLELDPTYAPARVELAVLFAQEGDAERAEAELKQALRDRPYYPQAHYNYGTFLISQGTPEAALERFRRAVEIEPQYLKAQYGVFAVEFELGHLDAARRTFRILEEIAPESEEATMARRLLEVDS